ncbi:polysaccharide pyruvyl transferase family protein [Lachnospiraceae bacterium TF09-5]|nr:polysaccharide pyruvyl transferase family protein [Lachnospiraceae bacterium TF09-5]
MKIIITNVYCYQNKGDAGIVVSIIENLKKKFPDAKIKIVSLYPEIDNGKYDPDVEVLPPILIYKEEKNKYLTTISNFCQIIIKSIKYKTKAFNTKTEKEIANADLIVSCGGGYMQARSLKQFVNGMSYHYLQLLCAKEARKNYVIFAQTIGPFSNITQEIVKPIMEKAKVVLAREEISYKYSLNAFPKANIKLTTDTAFLLKSHPVDKIFPDGQMKIGITVRKWVYPGYDIKSMNEKYINAFSGFIDKVIEEYGAKIYIMPQCIGPGSDNDLIMSRNVMKQVKHKDYCELLEGDYSPGQLKYIYSKMDYFVGTRMHSNIFSLAEAVPCLAVSYDYKTDGIMRLIGMDNYVLNINEISQQNLWDLFIQLVSNGYVKEELRKKVENIKQDASYNYDLL